MSRYTQLLEETRGGIAEAPPPDLPPELELQALWFAGAFGRRFTDRAGRAVRVVQFGEWNRGAGPDFLHAVIEIDDELREGPLEIDLEPADWEAHGHGANPAFDRTVLHVVFRDTPSPSFTRSSSHREIPQVRVPDPRIAEGLGRPVRPIAIARPGRCRHPLAALSEEATASLLRQAAEHRARGKALRFLRTADAHGRDAALWQATAETLGYRSNSLAMRLLSQRLPLAAAREDPDARLFGAAGFLSPELHEQAPPDTRARLRGLWDRWWRDRGHWESSHPIPWQHHGQRPANHPHRRVAALAVLARAWPGFRRLALARPFRPGPLVDYLAALDDPFWSRRHTLSSGPSRRPVALFGNSRATELLANHLVPLALREDPGFGWDDYLRLPAGTRNEKVRRCAIRLFGSEETAGRWLRRAAHHQALLQVYRDFCLQDLSDCHDCPFPEQLAQWELPLPPAADSPFRS